MKKRFHSHCTKDEINEVVHFSLSFEDFKHLKVALDSCLFLDDSDLHLVQISKLFKAF